MEEKKRVKEKSASAAKGNNGDKVQPWVKTVVKFIYANMMKLMLKTCPGSCVMNANIGCTLNAYH